jgi:hypothetical protein
MIRMTLKVSFPIVLKSIHQIHFVLTQDDLLLIFYNFVREKTKSLERISSRYRDYPEGLGHRVLPRGGTITYSAYSDTTQIYT